MTQQKQMLSAAQNEPSHAPLIDLYLTSSDLLSAGVFLFVLQTGNSDHWRRNHQCLLLSSSADPTDTNDTGIILTSLWFHHSVFLLLSL